MRGSSWLGGCGIPFLVASLVSIPAGAETTSKRGKAQGAVTAAAATSPPAARSTGSTAPAATSASAVTPAATSATPVAASATTASGTSATTATGTQPAESPHITWSSPFTLERVSGSIGPEFGSNDLNLGFGLRFGYTIRQAVYFGLAADYWLGTSQEATVPGAGTITASAHAWDVLGDVGYDLAPSPTLVVRPFVGFGIYGAYGEACTSAPGAPTTMCVKSHGSKGAGSLGGQVLVDLGGINLGGELRILIAGDTAALLGARVGMVF